MYATISTSLDAYLFNSIHEAQAITEEWLQEYNAIWPQSALGDLPHYQYQSDHALISTSE